MIITLKLQRMIEQRMIEHVLEEKTEKEAEDFVIDIERKLRVTKIAINKLPKDERAKVAYFWIDKYLEDSISPCKKGCRYCCYVHVTCTKLEGELIRKTVKERNIEIDHERLKVQADLEAPYMITKRIKHDIGNLPRVDIQWLKLPMELRRCVFLNEANECSIYDVRPARCRTHMSAEENAELCDTSDGIREIFMRVNPEAEIIVSALEQISPIIGLASSLVDCNGRVGRSVF